MTETAIPAPAPYTSRYVTVHGLKLRCVDYGRAGQPPVLCIHGSAANAHWFDFIAPAFTADRHMLALELRGHGDSQWAEPPAYRYNDYAADMNEAVDALGLQRFTLVGHSMGGMASLHYAAKHPDRVERLVVIDTTLIMAEERVAVLRGIGERSGRDYANHEEYLARFRLSPKGSTAGPEVLRHVALHSGRQTAEGTWRHKFDRRIYADRGALSSMPFWAELKMPALLVRGALSPRISDALVEEVRRNCPHVVVTDVPGSDHHVMLDNPAGCAAALRDFFDKTTA